MKALIIPIKQKLTLLLLSGLTIIFNPVMAESDLQTKEAVKNVKEKSQKHGNHSKDTKLVLISKDLPLIATKPQFWVPYQLQQ